MAGPPASVTPIETAGCVGLTAGEPVGPSGRGSAAGVVQSDWRGSAESGAGVGPGMTACPFAAPGARTATWLASVGRGQPLPCAVAWTGSAVAIGLMGAGTGGSLV